MNRSHKKENEHVDTVWEIETATEKVARSKMSKLQILQQQLTGACICNAEWLQCALEILAKNSIDRAVFSDAIIKLLVMGWGKGRNIFICGPANCRKTFILDPLRVIFNAFLSPAIYSYAWLGVEDKEVTFFERSQVVSCHTPVERHAIIIGRPCCPFCCSKNNVQSSY